MKKNIFAICDQEETYLLRLADYLSNRSNVPFDIQAFTSVENLMAYEKEHSIELLLIAERTFRREVMTLRTGRTILLSEGMASPTPGEYPSVYKYQAAGALLRDVMGIYADAPGEGAAAYPVLKKETQVYAVYSPIRRCLKTSIALTLGLLLAEEKPALYVNLDPFPGLSSLLGVDFSGSLGDILYDIREEKKGLIHQINSIAHALGRLDILPGVRLPWDLCEALYEDWKKFIAVITRETAYGVLILDIGCEIDGLPDILEECDYIYMPVLKDRVSQEKLREFDSLLEKMGRHALAARITRLSPALQPEIPPDLPYAQALLHGPLGAYVRKLLKEKENL